MRNAFCITDKRNKVFWPKKKIDSISVLQTEAICLLLLPGNVVRLFHSDEVSIDTCTWNFIILHRFYWNLVSFYCCKKIRCLKLIIESSLLFFIFNPYNFVIIMKIIF